MIKKKIILSVLIFTMSLYVCHDLLPYHSHGMSHFISNNPDCQLIEKTDDDNHHCDGHVLCVTCLLKEQTKIKIRHMEIDFSVDPTDIIIKIENIKVPANHYSHLFSSDNFYRYKSQFIRQTHSLRAPPAFV